MPIGEDQWRSNLQDIVLSPTRADKNTLVAKGIYNAGRFSRIRIARAAVADHFHAQHQSRGANISELLMLVT